MTYRKMFIETRFSKFATSPFHTFQTVFLREITKKCNIFPKIIRTSKMKSFWKNESQILFEIAQKICHVILMRTFHCSQCTDCHEQNVALENITNIKTFLYRQMIRINKNTIISFNNREFKMCWLLFNAGQSYQA